jgi:transcriptional regulator with XRE-family HTH domain
VFVERIKAAMKENGVTVNDLAEALELKPSDVAEHLTHWKIYTNGDVGDFYINIAKVLNCSLDYLFGINDCMNTIGR